MLHFVCTYTRRACVLALVLFLCAMSQQAWAHGDERPDKVGILLVSFGTSVPEAQKAYADMEALVKQKYPDIPVRWAFTSKIIRNKLKKEGKVTLSPAEALAAMADEDFTHVAVQSLHVIPGEEYYGLLETAHAFAGMPKGIKRVLVGYPLLSTSADLDVAARAILDVAAKLRGKDQALILVGHGTHHPADVVYAALQYHFQKLDPMVFVGTVEGVPSMDAVLADLKAEGIKDTVLMPLMSVAGDHAQNDMAGPEPDSWKSTLNANDIACAPMLKGLAEYPELAQLWIAHLDVLLQHFDAGAAAD